MATIHRVFVYLLYVWRAKPVETESTCKRFDDHELWLIVTIERQFDFEIVILSNEFWFFENSSKDNEPPKYIFQMEYDIWQSLKNRFISNIRTSNSFIAIQGKKTLIESIGKSFRWRRFILTIS